MPLSGNRPRWLEQVRIKMTSSVLQYDSSGTPKAQKRMTSDESYNKITDDQKVT